MHRSQCGCFKKKPEQFCNLPGKQVCTRGSKAANAVLLLFLRSPPMHVLLHPKCCGKVLGLTYLPLLQIAVMTLFTQQCISKKHFLLSKHKNEGSRSLRVGSRGRTGQPRQYRVLTDCWIKRSRPSKSTFQRKLEQLLKVGFS